MYIYIYIRRLRCQTEKRILKDSDSVYLPCDNGNKYEAKEVRAPIEKTRG